MHYNSNKRIPKYRHSGREPKPLVDACDRYCSRDHKFTRTFATNLPLSRELHIWDATVRTYLPTRCTWQRINSKVICHVKVETHIFSPYIYTFPMIPGITVLPKTLECIQIFIELYFVITRYLLLGTINYKMLLWRISRHLNILYEKNL